MSSGAAAVNKLSLVKNGTGKQVFNSGFVSYTGATTVNQGVLELFNTPNFASATTINNGGTLLLSNSLATSHGTGATVTINDGGILERSATVNATNWFVLNGGVNVSGNATINENSIATARTGDKNFFLDGGLHGSGTVTINANSLRQGVTFRNNNSTFAGRIIVNGTASTTVNQNSGIAVGGATTALQNVDFTLNGTMELLNQGLGWGSPAPGVFSMGALDGTGVMVGNFTAGSTTTVTMGNTNVNGNFSGTIANGTGNTINVTKVGTGTQTFTGNKFTYTGQTTVNAGTLRFVDVINFNSAIRNDSIVEINSAAGNKFNLELSKLVSGSGTWIKTGAGDASFYSSTFTTTGRFLIQEGKLQNDFNAVNWSASTADIDISAGATLDLFADAIFVDQLTGAGTIQNNWGNAAGQSGSGQFIEKLVVGVANGNSNFAGIIRNNSSTNIPANTAAGGGISLEKTGTGMFELSGANTYTGTTTVNAGTLQVTGSIALGSEVTVNTGATLAGAGTIFGTTVVASGAKLSPGNTGGTAIGTLTMNAVTLNAGGTLSVGLSSAVHALTEAQIANKANYAAFVNALGYGMFGVNDALDGGSFYDALELAGNMIFNGGLAITSVPSAPLVGSIFDVLDAASYTGPTPAVASFGGFTFDTSLFSSHGILILIPEPGKASFALLGFLCFALRRQRMVA